MKKINLFLSMFAALIVLTQCAPSAPKSADAAKEPSPRWTKEQASEWYGKQPWLAGCDFIPSTAINQLEMWQAESFDTATINRELGYAESIGFNTARVYLHHKAWLADSAGFKGRMDQFLTIAQKHHIKPLFVFFDDCWNPISTIGKQPAPKTGIHNSGWLQDPGQEIYDNTALVSVLERYVKDVLTSFKDDQRILLWDLYNEPGNSNWGNKSMTLLQQVFGWARQVNPSQPVSAGVWNISLVDLNKYQLDNSDVVTYHCYDTPDVQKLAIDSLKRLGYPLICTEYMARTRNCTFNNTMPLLKAENVAAINWGLVDGKTNCKYAWSTPMPNGGEPELWFHEIFHPDGTPYKQDEVELIKSLTGKK